MICVQNVIESLYVANFVWSIGKDKIQCIITSSGKVDQLPQVVVFDCFCKVVVNKKSMRVSKRLRFLLSLVFTDRRIE